MNFLKIFSDSFIDNWDKKAVISYSTGFSLDYGGLAARIDCIKLLLEHLEVPKGSNVAVLGLNSIDWIVNYLGIMTYGCIPVTYRASYDANEMIGAIASVDVELVFMDEHLIDKLDYLEDLEAIKLIISQDCQKILYSRSDRFGNASHIISSMDLFFANRYPNGFQPSDLTGYFSLPDSLAAIFFSSGTLGLPKPVMLSHDNLEAIIVFGLKNNLFPRSSNTLTSNSMSNVWGTFFNVLIPLASGATIVVFNAIYTPQALIKALCRVKPRRIILSPNQLHDIYDMLEKQQRRSRFFKYIRYLLFGDWLARLALRRSINQAFGGKCIEVIIVSTNLERHLRQKLDRAKINYTVSYGLTECGGLVTYTPASDSRQRTVGRTVHNFIKCRVRPIEIPGFPENAGELELHGMLVMKGYYNDEGANHEAFTRDGWLRTGDIVDIDKDGYIRILARKETMIQHGPHVIVPERLEATLNEMLSIGQAIVIDRDGSLTAIIRPDVEAIGNRDIYNAVHEDVAYVNRHTPNFINIEQVDIIEQPFEMTLKDTVARYKYF